MSTLAISYALMCFDLVWCCCLGLFAGHDVETKLWTHQRSAIHLEFSVATYMKINPFKGFHIQRARIFQEIPNIHFDVVSAKSSCCNRKQPVRRINQQTWRSEANTHGQPHCTGPEDLSSSSHENLRVRIPPRNKGNKALLRDYSPPFSLIFSPYYLLRVLFNLISGGGGPFKCALRFLWKKCHEHVQVN